MSDDEKVRSVKRWINKSEYATLEQVLDGEFDLFRRKVDAVRECRFGDVTICVLITEVKNGKPGVVDEWTISEAIPVEYLMKK
jgi:hypothetical protein